MQAEPTSTTPKTALSEATFAPMPLRARNILEVVDMAIKAFKQYFWVLTGWAAVVNAASIIGSIVPGLSYVISLFTPPVIIGACTCCIAAAVRGQKVEFGQCWQFTKPRYWPMVGIYTLSVLIAILIAFVCIVVIGLLVVGGVFLFQGAPSGIQITAAVIGGIVLGLLASIVFTALFVWQGIVCIVVGMEEDKRNSQALSRAYELLRGYWLPTVSLMMVLGLGILALWAILGTVAVLMAGFGNIRSLFSGTWSPDTSFWTAFVAFLIGTLLLWMLFTPLYYLTLNLLYLDLRVRKEALDIEWTAHATAPVVPVGAYGGGYDPNAYAPASGNFTPVTGFAPNSGIAPPQSSPTPQAPPPQTPPSGATPPLDATQQPNSQTGTSHPPGPPFSTDTAPFVSPAPSSGPLDLNKGNSDGENSGPGNAPPAPASGPPQP